MSSLATDNTKISKHNMPDTVEELNDLISKLTFLKNFPDEEERQKRQQQFYESVGGMEVDIDSFESIEDAISSAEELKLKKEKEQEENGRETNFEKMLKSKRKIIKIDKRRLANKLKPIDSAKLADILTKRDRHDSSSDEELNSFNPTKKKRDGGRRTRGKLRSKSRAKSRKKRRKSRRKSRRKKRRRKKRTKRRR